MVQEWQSSASEWFLECLFATPAKDAATDDGVEALLIAAVFHPAIGRSGEEETLFARVTLKDAETVKLAKAELAPRCGVVRGA